jgi:serine/threonine-protein kinase
MPTKDPDYAETLPFQPGMTIAEKYRVERLVAAGGMGAVLLAHHEVLDRRVAIKLMRPELASHREAAQRFLREARAAARIESDFVARVTDVDVWDDTPFMVMEYLEGGDLESLIEGDASLTVSDAVDIAIQALAGLHAAHAIGVIHRDLKPSNLFLVTRADGTRRVKILDFGISKVVGDDSDGLKAGATTSSQAMLGTPRYMSPEQVSSAKDVDVRTDLWAMGLILYELLTKSYPFEGDSAGAILAGILTHEVPPAHDFRRDVPKELDAVIARLLEKKRDGRFPTAKSVMKALAPHASRRIQALLFTQDELQGALADTESQGTPSEVLEARTLAAAQSRKEPAEDVALAETALSSPGLEVTLGSASPPGSGTDTAMSVAGVDDGKGGALKLVAFAGAAALLIGIGIFIMQSGPDEPAMGAPTADATDQPGDEPSADPTPPVPTASTAAPEPSVAPAASQTASAASSAAPQPPAPVGQPRPFPPASPRPTPPPSPSPRPSPSPKPSPDDLLGEWD